MYEVVYFSRSGNTKKVAEAVAGELGAAAQDIKTAGRVADDAFIILGSGCYGAVLVKDIAEFLERNGKPGRRIALFTTSAFGLGKEMDLMVSQIRAKGVEIAYSFNCFGQFLAVKRGHPDKDELEKAREFAREITAGEALRTYKPAPELAAVR
jgi:flavodoxin